MMSLVFSTKPALRFSVILAREICDRTTGKMRCNFCSKRQRGNDDQNEISKVFARRHHSSLFHRVSVSLTAFSAFRKRDGRTLELLILVTFN